MLSTEKLLHLFYHDRRDWVDGTARYAELLKRHVAPHAQVLDIGPGEGNGFQHRYYLEGRYIVGIDPDPNVLKNMHLDEAAVGRVEELPFGSDTFDAAVSNYALEHIQYPYTAARELHRVLKPEGVFVFRTPNLLHYVTLISYLTPHSFHNLVAKWARGTKGASDPFPTTYRCNTRGAIQRFFSTAGFRILVLNNIEAEPMYLQFSPMAFLLGVAYERLVNSHRIFEHFRANILGVLQKRPERARTAHRRPSGPCASASSDPARPLPAKHPQCTGQAL